MTSPDPPTHPVSRGLWLFRGLMTVAGAVTVCLVLYLHVRLETHEREHVALERLWSQHVEEAKQHINRIAETAIRLDALERVLFGEVLTTIQQQQQAMRPQPRLSLWQQMRDRERLLQLELARQKIEQRLDQLAETK